MALVLVDDEFVAVVAIVIVEAAAVEPVAAGPSRCSRCLGSRRTFSPRIP